MGGNSRMGDGFLPAGVAADLTQWEAWVAEAGPNGGPRPATPVPKTGYSMPNFDKSRLDNFDDVSER